MFYMKDFSVVIFVIFDNHINHLRSYLKQSTTPGGVMGNMLASHTINLGSILGRGGYIMTRMITIMAVPCHWTPQCHVKEPWRR